MVRYCIDEAELFWTLRCTNTLRVVRLCLRTLLNTRTLAIFKERISVALCDTLVAIVELNGVRLGTRVLNIYAVSSVGIVQTRFCGGHCALLALTAVQVQERAVQTLTCTYVPPLVCLFVVVAGVVTGICAFGNLLAQACVVTYVVPARAVAAFQNVVINSIARVLGARVGADAFFHEQVRLLAL